MLTRTAAAGGFLEIRGDFIHRIRQVRCGGDRDDAAWLLRELVIRAGCAALAGKLRQEAAQSSATAAKRRNYR